MKRETVITARGEMTPAQADIILRYLGRQGLSTEMLTEDSPGLGTATLEDFQDFNSAESQETTKVRRLGARIFMALWRASASAESVNSPRADRYRKFQGLVNGRELDLNLLEQHLIAGNLESLPNFGSKSAAFVSDFIDRRRQQVFESTDQQPVTE